MIDRPFRWRVVSAFASGRAPWTVPDDVRIGARFQFADDDGSQHTFSLTDKYAASDLPRLHAFLLAIRLFPSDVIRLLTAGTFDDAMKNYLAGRPLIFATARVIRCPRFGVPYELHDHRPVQGQEWRRDTLGLPDPATSNAETMQWIRQRSSAGREARGSR